jgi:hypothetical protein
MEPSTVRTWASASVAAARARHRHVAADELRGAIVAAAGSLAFLPPRSSPAGLRLSLSSLLFLQEALQRHVRPLDPYKGGGPALADRWGRGRNNDGPTNYRRHATHVGDSRNCLSLCCCLEIDAAALLDLDLGHSGRHIPNITSLHACYHSLVKATKHPAQFRDILQLQCAGSWPAPIGPSTFGYATGVVQRELDGI